MISIYHIHNCFKWWIVKNSCWR